MTKYSTNNRRYIPREDTGTPISIGNEWTQDPNPEYICQWCRRTLSTIIDSSGQNPSLYCNFCRISSEIEDDTMKKTKLKIPKGKITEPAVGYAPEVGLKRKTVEYKGGLKVLSQKGMKITNYKEGKG